MRIVGGKYRRKHIIPPTHVGTRPTADRTRESLFNILQHNPRIAPVDFHDKTVLDVFAGTGALGLETLSRGAKVVTFIENNPQTLPILYANLKAFNLPPSCVLEQDVRVLGNNPHEPYDFIFMDPPYHQGLMSIACTQLRAKGWIRQNGMVVIELAKDEDYELPPFLHLELNRISGAARLLFCRATFCKNES